MQRVVKAKKVCQDWGVSRMWLHRKHASDPTFPRKVRLSSNSVGYLEHELDAWLRAQADQRVRAC